MHFWTGKENQLLKLNQKLKQVKQQIDSNEKQQIMKIIKWKLLIHDKTKYKFKFKLNLKAPIKDELYHWFNYSCIVNGKWKKYY